MPTPERPGTAIQPLDLPEDIKRELLQAQKGMIQERQQLPQVKMMPAGVGMFEFVDSGETTREFHGIILGSHARNVLWDKPYGQQVAVSEEEKGRPACVSNDGKTGIPRVGFAHAALQRRGATTATLATGTERIVCRTCPYNQWGSKGLLPALLRAGETPETAKGKAVVNQRAVYVLVPGRETPIQLILPPTSITGFDEYLATTLNQGQPVQAIITEFRQEIKQKGGLRWAQATFRAVQAIDAPTFQRVISARTEYRSQIEGIAEELVVVEPEGADPLEGSLSEPEAGAPRADDEGDDEVPF